MSRRKTLLWVTATCAQLWYWRGGRLDAGARFSADDEGWASFAAALREIRDPLWVLADLPEETYLRASVMSIPGLDLGDAEQRRIQQLLATSPFHLTMLQSRDQEDEHPSERLYLVQGGPARLLCWLDPMQQVGVPLAGIHSAALVASPLIGTPMPEDLLLITRMQGVGVRTSYYAHGALKFSRLLPHLDDARVRLSEEIERTRYFLLSQNLLSPQSQLEIRLLGADDESSSMVVGGGDISVLRPSDCARRLKLPQSLAQDADATPLLLGLLATRIPDWQLAPAERLQLYRRWRWRRILHGSSLAIWLIGLPLLGGLAWLSAGERTELGNQRQQAVQLELRANTLLAALPGTAAERAEVRQAVQSVAGLREGNAAPSWLLAELAAILDQQPQVRLQHLSWIVGHPLRLELNGIIDDSQGTAALQLATLRQNLSRRGLFSSASQAVLAADNASGERSFTLSVERVPR